MYLSLVFMYCLFFRIFVNMYLSPSNGLLNSTGFLCNKTLKTQVTYIADTPSISRLPFTYANTPCEVILFYENCKYEEFPCHFIIKLVEIKNLFSQ